MHSLQTDTEPSLMMAAVLRLLRGPQVPCSPRSMEPLHSPRQELTKQLPYRLWPISQGRLKPGTQTLQGILSDSMKNTVDKCLILKTLVSYSTKTLFSGCSLTLSVLC